MRIENTQINTDLGVLLNELQSQLILNGSGLLRKFKETPTHIQVPCPYHKGGQERRVSAGIRKEDGLFHCFTCGEVHSLPEVVSHCFGYEDMGMYGWQWILKNFGTIQINERSDINLDFERQREKHYTRYISETELDSYRYSHPYMYKRKMTDEVIEIFDIGYDKKARCITFPVRDITGNTLFVARRSVNTKYFNYPQGVVKPIYGLYELQTYADVEKLNHYGLIVTESMIDAITVWVYGKYAVALNGLGNSLQFRQLRELGCRKLILATDNDEAGLSARIRIKQNINNKLISEYVFPNDKKDINDLTKSEFDSLVEVF